MKTITSVLTNYINTRDEWLYLSLILIFSLYQVESNSWAEYTATIFSNSIYLAPLIIFKMFQKTIKHRLSANNYQHLKILFFFVYPMVIFLWMNALKIPDSFTLKIPAVIVLFGASIEFFIFLNHSMRHQRLINFSPKKIGLNELILFFMLFFAIYAALLIASDLPLWLTSNSIQTTLNFSEIANRPLLTLGLAFQMFSLFFCGYIFFWINQRILVPSVLKARGPLIYFCAVITTVVLLYPILIELYLLFPINSMAEPIIPAVNANAFDWQNGRVFLAVMLLSLPIILVTQWHKKSNQFALLEKENIQTELQLLKQQIDPHFFFNTLNNLYALCRKKSEQAPEVVLQLAELMQYVVYRGQERNVLLDEDISYIEDYISLQSIRFGNKVSLKTDVNIDDLETVISPLLLIILVENAFKHGIELATKDCYLQIQITEKDQQLSFRCENSIEHDNAPDEENTLLNNIDEGVGLTNLKRRLTLIYPNGHQLLLSKQYNKFTARLSIDLASSIYLTNPEINNE